MSAFQRELIDHTPVLRAYALIYCRRSGDADDLLQDTLEKAWRARDQFQPGTSMKAWLFTILRNGVYNEWRRSRRIVEDPNGDYAATLHAEAGQGWRAEFVDVLNAMGELDSESRESLLLITAGLSYEEAALVCGCPLRTLQSRVRRARQRLVEAMNDDAFRTPDQLRALAAGS